MNVAGGGVGGCVHRPKPLISSPSLLCVGALRGKREREIERKNRLSTF